MTTLHAFSNRHIKNEVKNIKNGDWVYLENSLSKKRWSLFFKDFMPDITVVEVAPCPIKSVEGMVY
jgi:hypothetical protein